MTFWETAGAIYLGDDALDRIDDYYQGLDCHGEPEMDACKKRIDRWCPAVVDAPDQPPISWCRLNRRSLMQQLMRKLSSVDSSATLRLDRRCSRLPMPLFRWQVRLFLRNPWRSYHFFSAHRGDASSWNLILSQQLQQYQQSLKCLFLQYNPTEFDGDDDDYEDHLLRSLFVVIRLVYTESC